MRETGAQGDSKPVSSNGNSKGSNRPQHTYDVEREPGGNDPPGVVKTGVSGAPLNKNDSSPRANAQVNKLNAKEKGKNTYTAKVTKANITKSKNKTARQRALDRENNRAQKHFKDSQPMDRHTRPGRKD
jgi:URI fold toxin 2